MKPFNSKHGRGNLAYLLSFFLVTAPHLAHSQLNAIAGENRASETEHQHAQHQGAQQKTYACPMHPEETSHQPGSLCPKCNMFLVEVEQVEQEDTDAHQNDASVEKTYACPMHPEETSHEAGSRCPKCNMFLVEVEEEEETGADNKALVDHGSMDHGSMDHGQQDHDKLASKGDTLSQAKPAPLNSEPSIKYVCPMHAHIISDVPGTCPICGMNLEKVEVGGSQHEVQVDVSGGMQQALALKVAKADRETLQRFVSTVGQVGYDESQISHIHARVNGWIEKLKVKSEGDKITKGQLLYEIYSPDLINAQDDYLLAIASMRSSGSKDYKDLVRRAGLRLELLGMNRSQIDQLAKSGKTQYRVPFYAQGDGIVKQLSVREGMYIQPATEVLSLVDLSKVWVIADVFENEQSWLAIGQQAKVSVPAMGLEGIEGEIDYIYPELDPVTRSLRVRIVLQNQDITLRPNTLAKVEILGGPNKDALVVPQEALIQTGQSNRVIVKQDDNSFVAREVKVGMMSQGKAEILSGIEQGDSVVTSGQFLLDSEASLKGSLMRLSSGHQH